MSACIAAFARQAAPYRCRRHPPPPPLLVRDELPENDEEHPDAAAIKAIMADTTPEEQAEGFKVQACGSVLAGRSVWCTLCQRLVTSPNQASKPGSSFTHHCLVPLQNMGNDALKAGLRHKKKFYLRQAIEQYGKGLEVMVRCTPGGGVLPALYFCCPAPDVGTGWRMLAC